MGQFLKTYQILYKKAVVDLNSAKVILDSFNKGDIELDLEVICFHLQQCSEKLIKSVLDINNIKYKNTHDLKNLTNLLEKHSIILEQIERLVPLSIYAVDERYDTIQDDINDIEVYIVILNDLITSVEHILKEEN